MSTYFPNKDEEPGDVIQTASVDGGTGSVSMAGTLDVYDVATFHADAYFLANIILSSSTIVDISSNTIYSFADPIIDLNTTFTGLYIPEAGLRVFRGSGLDQAFLKFMEDPTRTTLEWRIGVGLDLLRIARIPDTMADRHAIYWDDGHAALATHPFLAFNATSITSMLPTFFQYMPGAQYSYYRYNSVMNPAFVIDRWNVGTLMAQVAFGFKDATYGGITSAGIGTITGKTVLQFSLDTPSVGDDQYIFEGILSIGKNGADIAIVRSERATLRLEGHTAVTVRNGTTGNTFVQLIESLCRFDSPVHFYVPTGGSNSAFIYTDIIDPAVGVWRWDGINVLEHINMGFKTFTYDAFVNTGAPRISGDKVLLFGVDTPSHDRTRYVFEGVASMGRDDATTALIRTDMPALRIEGRDQIDLRASAAGTSHVIVTDIAMTVNVDMTVNGTQLYAIDGVFQSVTSYSIGCYYPPGFNPLPPALFPLSITYDGVTSAISARNTQGRLTYEVSATHTIAAGTGTNYTVYMPINIGNDMVNIRSMSGVVQKLSGGIVTRVYGLPPNDLSVEVPFDVNPPIVTAAALAGYHLLSVRMMSVTGTWSVIVTIDTRHPLVH